MTEQGPEQGPQQPDVDTCVACGRPVQFSEPIGDGPGWWGHVHSADSLSRHRVVLTEDDPEQAVGERDAAAGKALLDAAREVEGATSIPIVARAAVCAVLRGRARRLLATPDADAQDDGRAVVEVHSLEEMKQLMRRAADEAAVHRLARAMAARDRSSRPFDSWESEVEFILATLPQVLADLGYGTEPPASPTS